MFLNEATIPHYRSEMIPTEKLKKMVLLNEEHLKEKPTWYIIENSLKYFKQREIIRIFCELFYSKFASQIMDLQTLQYKVTYVRTYIPGEAQSKEKTECGLLYYISRFKI